MGFADRFLDLFASGGRRSHRGEGSLTVADLQQGPSVEAATLTPPPIPKAPNKPQGLPGYRTRVEPSATAIPRPSVLTASLDRVVELRSRNNDYEAARTVTKYSPEISSAVSLALRMSITDSYTLVGRNLDGQIDRNATLLAHELLRRLTFMGAADGSFGAQQALNSLSETLLLDLIHTGALSLEVALDKARVPASINPIAVKTLVFFEEDNAFRVAQRIGGVDIDLDIPTFIYVAMDQVVTEAYPTSMLTAVIQAVLVDLDFNNDIRRVLKRAVLPRMNSIIDSEKFRKMTPPEIAADPEKYIDYQNAAIAAVQGVINGLAPEDALVNFDYVEHKYVDGGPDAGELIEKVQSVLNAKLVAGSRALPVTLGFAKTSGASSAESLLFLKHCEGLQKKLNEAISRALTVAIRVLGVDCYVEFKYSEPNIKPQEELEAFKAMRQSRLLEQLSLGLLTDDEAAVLLTGHLPPPGMKPLSGTMFAVGKPAAGNPTSNTANAVERETTPDTPTKPKS